MLRPTLVVLVLSLAACGDMGTYTPGTHHGGDEASVGSHLSGVDNGDGTNASTATYSHFGTGTTSSGGH